jgi:hypothetical protein
VDKPGFRHEFSAEIAMERFDFSDKRRKFSVDNPGGVIDSA